MVKAVQLRISPNLSYSNQLLEHLYINIIPNLATKLATDKKNRLNKHKREYLLEKGIDKLTELIIQYKDEKKYPPQKKLIGRNDPNYQLLHAKINAYMKKIAAGYQRQNLLTLKKATEATENLRVKKAKHTMKFSDFLEEHKIKDLLMQEGKSIQRRIEIVKYIEGSEKRNLAKFARQVGVSKQSIHELAYILKKYYSYYQRALEVGIEELVNSFKKKN